MAIFISTLILVTISVSLLQAQIVPYPTPPERNVASMCAAAICPKGTICRVVQACDLPGCFPHVECLPCVPEGVDDVCNTRNYINTVLVGKAKENTSLMPLYCNPKLNNDISGCPSGSVCASSDKHSFVGTCCYGKPERLPALNINNDKRCDSADQCAEKCEKGFECKPATSDCGILTYSCQPMYKPGRCPPIPFSNYGFCLRARVGRMCENDSDCKGDKKCCRTICNRRACLSPF